MRTSRDTERIGVTREMDRLTRRKGVWILAVVLAAILVAARNAGRMLVVDAPERSDVILVLAGETDRRPARALQLLDQGYGRRVVIDVPAAARIYGVSQVEIAEKYVGNLPYCNIGSDLSNCRPFDPGRIA